MFTLATRKMGFFLRIKLYSPLTVLAPGESRGYTTRGVYVCVRVELAQLFAQGFCCFAVELRTPTKRFLGSKVCGNCKSFVV